jgi:hypothetical protein
MTAWTSDELARVAAAEEPRIAPRRRDGTPRNPPPVRVVRHDDDPDVPPVDGAARRRQKPSRALTDEHVGAFLA